MKAVILAGGLGTRLSEETVTKPKPMVEVGGRPILWHIMKIYSSFGVNDFIICCGYKGYLIKEYFVNYGFHMSDITVHLQDNSIEVHQNMAEPWNVTLVDTGEATMTGGRMRKIGAYLRPGEDFCFTYGDGVGNVDIGALIQFHRDHGKLATMTVAQPPGRFGAISLEGMKVTGFKEKPKGDGAYVNAGFFVLSESVIEYVGGDHTIWEAEPLEELSKSGQLMAFPHSGFWQPMDTMRDKVMLEDLWQSGSAPWRSW